MIMDKKVVWKLSKKEEAEISDLFEKKIALENLAKVVDASNDSLYSKIIKDYGHVLALFDRWWDEMSNKYNWEGNTWKIDFVTKEVIIVES